MANAGNVSTSILPYGGITYIVFVMDFTIHRLLLVEKLFVLDFRIDRFLLVEVLFVMNLKYIGSCWLKFYFFWILE